MKIIFLVRFQLWFRFRLRFRLRLHLDFIFDFDSFFDFDFIFDFDMSKQRYCNKYEKNWSFKNFSRHYNKCSKSFEVCQRCELFVKNLKFHYRRTLCDRFFTTLKSFFNFLLNDTFDQEHSSFVAEVLQKLYKCKTKTNETFMNWIQEKKWYHICNISSNVKELWFEILSRLFFASQC
jgi:hypothetical protein